MPHRTATANWLTSHGQRSREVSPKNKHLQWPLIGAAKENEAEVFDIAIFKSKVKQNKKKPIFCLFHVVSFTYNPIVLSV